MCGREFFELLKVSTLKFDELEKFFKLVKGLSFKCVKESFFFFSTSFKPNFKFVQEIFQVFESFL
jgi:hypothetical protein